MEVHYSLIKSERMNPIDSRINISILPSAAIHARVVSSEKLTDIALQEDEPIISKSRRVQFNEKVAGRVFQNIPEEERATIWYTKADVDEARRNEKILREAFSSNEQLFQQNQENLNAQGVMTDEQIAKVDLLVKASTKAVFEEQERQEKMFVAEHKTGKFHLNEYKIAEAYRIHAQEALEQARNRAVRHEKHVRKETEVKRTSEPVSPFPASKYLRKGVSPVPSPQESPQTSPKRSPKQRASKSLVQKLILPLHPAFVKKAVSSKVPTVTSAT